MEVVIESAQLPELNSDGWVSVPATKEIKGTADHASHAAHAGDRTAEKETGLYTKIDMDWKLTMELLKEQMEALQSERAELIKRLVFGKFRAPHRGSWH